MSVAVRHELTCPLGGRIKADWMIYRVMDTVRQTIVGTIYRTGRSEKQMIDPLRPAALQHIQKTNDITVHVAVRCFQGVPHPCLSREVDDGIKVGACKKRLHTLAICQIQRLELEGWVPLQLRQTAAFQAGIVVVIEVVYPADNPAIGQQTTRQMKPDKTRSTGNKYSAFHQVVRSVSHCT